MRTFLVLADAAPGRAPENAVTLFPGEGRPGIVLSEEETSRQAGLYSTLYAALTAALAPRLAERLGAGEPAAAILARRVMVPLAHAYLDRVVRLGLLVEACAGDELKVASADFPGALERIEAFQQAAVSSPAFNQALLARVAPVWGLELGAPAAFWEPAPPARRPVNTNFFYYPRSAGKLLSKAWSKLAARPLSRVLGRIPVLSMAYAVEAFRREGFTFRLLAEIPPQGPPSCPPRDPALRARALAAAQSDFRAPLDRFLIAAGVADAGARARAVAGFGPYLDAFFPSAFLEGAPENLARAVRVLGRYRGRPLLHSEAAGTGDVFLLAAAKSLGMISVACQHGGHYGYIDEHVDALELEYAFCDRFVSWGWTKFPDEARSAPPRAEPLPSPWLSERAKYWRRAKPAPDAKKAFDVLFLSNKVKRFPWPPSAAINSRIDLIEPYAALLKDFVREAARREISVLHKPYDPQTVALLPATFRELAVLGGSYYRLREGFDKGLPPETLAQCGLVVWDQPGTGFLECLTAGIPTLVYWPRLYNRETPEARERFAALEKTGVVHRTLDGLFTGVENYLAAPGSWRGRPERNAAVARFCSEYARASDDWPEAWREFLEKLR
jgi:hypothetical protein